MVATTFKELQERANKRWDKLHSTHWIRIGGGSLGQAAGSYSLHDFVKAFVKDNKVKAGVTLASNLGLSFMDPMMSITQPDGLRIYYGNLTKDGAGEIIKAHIVEGKPPLDKAFACEVKDGDPPAGVPLLQDLPQIRPQTRVITSNFGNTDPRDIMHYIANGGYTALHTALADLTPKDVIQSVKDSGLRGRGGAAFPAGVKWSFLEPSNAPLKYVLCNCEEGDPGAFNDKGIIENDPHKLLEGLILNGFATRSHRGFVFIRHGHDIPVDNMRLAIQQAYEYGILGENIFDSGFSFDAEVAFTGDSYVAGEETAMMEAIEGKRATPRFKPPFPAAAGLWGKPTNINNVKTLSYVPSIITMGAEQFKQIGTAGSSGTAIICLSGHIKKPGMYEVPMGVTIRQLLYDIGEGPEGGDTIKAIQTGGPLGGIMGAADFDVTICFDAMRETGAILGSGGIIVINETVDIPDLLRNIVAFNQFESCGKCFPCRLGYTHMLDVMERLCTRTARPGDLELLMSVGKGMQKGSLCGHGQLSLSPVASALKYFEDEFRLAADGSLRIEPMLTPTRTRP